MMDKYNLFCALVLATSQAPQYGHCDNGTRWLLHLNPCHPSSINLQDLVGAAYFMTNDPTGNSIVVNSIHTDGSLNFALTVSTRGNGGYAHRNGVPAGQAIPDPLFSQDSIIVGDNYLFAVNAGSNSVSMFFINPANPLKIDFKTDRSTNGDFPVSLTYSSKLKMLCALNAGAANGVQCFSVDDISGLTPLPGTARSLANKVPQTTPPSAPFGTFSDILFVQDSTELLISVKGNPGTGFLGFFASYAVNGQQLSVNPIINSPTGVVFPFSISIIPGSQEKAVLFGDPSFGYGVIDLGPVAGTEVNVVNIPIPDQVATCWSACSAKLNRCYTIDAVSTKVTEVSFGKDNGKTTSQIVKQYTAPGLLIDGRIASPSGSGKEFLYILSPSLQGVQVLALNGPGDAALVFTVPLAGAVLNRCGVQLSIAVQGIFVI